MNGCVKYLSPKYIRDGEGPSRLSYTAIHHIPAMIDLIPCGVNRDRYTYLIHLGMLDELIHKLTSLSGLSILMHGIIINGHFVYNVLVLR